MSADSNNNEVIGYNVSDTFEVAKIFSDGSSAGAEIPESGEGTTFVPSEPSKVADKFSNKELTSLYNGVTELSLKKFNTVGQGAERLIKALDDKMVDVEVIAAGGDREEAETLTSDVAGSVEIEIEATATTPKPKKKAAVKKKAAASASTGSGPVSHLVGSDAWENLKGPKGQPPLRHPKGMNKDIPVAALLLANPGVPQSATQLCEVSGFKKPGESSTIVVCISTGIRSAFQLSGIQTHKNPDNKEKHWVFDLECDRMFRHPEFKTKLNNLIAMMEKYATWTDTGDFSEWVMKAGFAEKDAVAIKEYRHATCAKALETLATIKAKVS